MFENDVKMYGTQASVRIISSTSRFENDVKMYGTQALIVLKALSNWFENDVKMCGTQDCDLNINKYKEIEYVPVEYPPTEEIMAELRALELEINKYMDELEKLLQE